jgi:low temperature requirement protein LtrA
MATVPAHSHHPPANGLLRRRVPGEHTRVTFFELFFDLVFVFAVTQISHGLAEHLDLEGAIHALMLLLAVWGFWIYTTWATNWLDPNHLAVRVMLVGVMLAGLIMSAAIPEAFTSDTRGLIFAICLGAANVGRTALVVFGTRRDARLMRNFERINVWLAAEAILWVAGGFASGDARVALWMAALLVLYLGPPTRFPVPGLGRSELSDWNTVEGSHMAERCGLFVIIALGESLLITGATFSDLEWTAATVSAMAAAFGTTVAMWWVYFDRTAEFASDLIAHAEDPGRLARLAYTYIHIPIIAGIILAAVGDEVVLAHPTGESHLSTALTVAGGPAVFLAGYILFKRAIVGRFFPSHLAALALLCALGAAYPLLTPVALTLGSMGVLVGIAAWARWLHPEPADEAIEAVHPGSSPETAGEPAGG